jgi:hypothetical protein
MGSYDWTVASAAIGAAIRKTRQNMQLNIDTDGLVHLLLEPDEQVYVHIGGAEVALLGGIVGTPGEGPLVQVLVTHPTARAEVEWFHPRDGDPYLDVRLFPEGSEEQYEA